MSNTIYEIQGVVHDIGDVMEFKNNFKKRILVLYQRTSFKEKVYEDKIPLEFNGEMIYKVDVANVGNKVKVSFVIQGREGKRDDLKGKYFTSLKAIGIEVLEATTAEQTSAGFKAEDTQQAVDGFVDKGGSNDGLPF